MAVVYSFSHSGANINHPDAAGNTPLHIAAALMDPVGLQLLVVNGADKKIKDNAKQTARAVVKKAIKSRDAFTKTFGLSNSASELRNVPSR